MHDSVPNDRRAERKFAQEQFETLPLLSVEQFAWTLRSQVREHALEFSWFLGAGCSVSSGIHPASRLVEKWLSELYHTHCLDDPSQIATDTIQRKNWIEREFGPLATDEPGTVYPEIIKRRFHTEVERQTVIEDLCANKRPGIGYLILAQLITHHDYGARWNTVLTTNFDELLADAIYFMGTSKARPQVISHQSLAPHIRLSANRPTVVKVHGDHMIGARNTADEIFDIGKPLETRLTRILDQSGLIFLGYGGYDPSIAKFLIQSRITHPIYWVGTSAPSSSIVEWLHQNDARRVSWPAGHERQKDGYVDFDQTLLALSRNFQLETLTHETLGKAFDSRKSELIEHVSQLSEPKVRKFEKEATSNASSDEEFERIFGHLMGPEMSSLTEAVKLEKINPAQAEENYRRVIKQFPSSARLLGSFANFLTDVCGKHDEANEHYRRAIEADPNRAITLGNYASFLTDIRKDHNVAEEYYIRAIKADPTLPATNSNYGVFLFFIRRNPDAAEAYYKSAIDINPKLSDALGNYAQLLLSQGRKEEGYEILRRAFESLSPTSLNKSLLAELMVYRYAHRPSDGDLGRLKLLIGEGARSAGWCFRPTLERAIADGHPQPELLKTITAVISGGAPPNSLDQFPPWQTAESKQESH